MADCILATPADRINVVLGLTLSYRSGLINAFKKIGRLGIFGAVAFGLSLLFLTMALHNSPIADVMFTLALVPILTALIAWVTLRERVQKVTWIAMIGAAIGIALMVVGHLNGGSMKGVGLGVGCAGHRFHICCHSPLGSRSRHDPHVCGGQPYSSCNRASFLI